MPRYHIRCIPGNGKPALYLTRDVNDFHDGTFTDRWDKRITFATPTGGNRRIEREEFRQPNKYYGHMTFEVVEEPDPVACARCGATIHAETSSGGKTSWVDDDGNDLCGWGGGGDPHDPA